MFLSLAESLLSGLHIKPGSMGEAPVREDGSVTRSAEVDPQMGFFCLNECPVSVFLFNLGLCCKVCGLVSCGRPLFGRPDGATALSAEVRESKSRPM